MRRSLLLAAALCLPLTAISQQSAEEEPGLFGRLFGGGGDEAADNGSFIERTLEDSLGGEGRQVDVQGFSGVLSGEARMESLTFADADGIWLRLENVVLDWNRGALLRGALDVTTLKAGLIELPRTPLPSEEMDVPTPEATGFSLPDLPVSVAIGELAADRVILGEALIGIGLEASVNGTLSLADGEGMADLRIDRLDADGEIALNASYANASNVLAIDLSMSEARGGIVATLAGIPGAPAIDFSVKGDAPLSAFTADIALASDGQPRLTGQVATSSPEAPAQFRVVADLSGDIAPLFAADYQDFFGDDVGLGLTVTTFEDGRVTLEDLTIDAEAIDLAGEVRIADTGVPDFIALKGEIKSDSGDPVLLPLSGPETRVDNVVLNVGFDASRGDDWTGRFEISNLVRPGFSAESLNLLGEGRIAPGDETTPREVTAILGFDATALDLASEDAIAALGESVAGQLNVNWVEGAPIALSGLDISGESYRLQGQATISPGDVLSVSGDLNVNARDLSVFSGLAGRRLGGSIEAETRFTAEPVQGTFDVGLTGQTLSLIVDQPEADRILQGLVTLDLIAQRDETGLRVQLKELSSPNADLTAEADLRSAGSVASISGSLADVGLVVPDLTGPVNLRANANEVDGIWQWEIGTDVASARLDAEGTVIDPLGTPIIAAAGTVAATDLTRFANLAKQDLSGAIDMGFSVEVVSDLSRATVDLRGTGANLQTGLADYDPLLTGDLRFVTAGSLIDGDLAISKIELENDLLNLKAEGRVVDPLGKPAVAAKGDIAVTDMSAFATLAKQDIAGALDAAFDVDLAGDLSRGAIDLRGSGQGLRTGLSEYDPLLVGDLTFVAVGSLVEDQVTIEDLQIRNDLMSLQTAGRVGDPFGTPAVAAAGNVAVEDLSAFATLAKRDIGGRIETTFDVDVVSDLSRARVDLNGRARDLITGIAEADRVLAGDVGLRTSGTLVAEDITLERLEFDSEALTIRANGAYRNAVLEGTLDLRAEDASVLLPAAPALPLTVAAEATPNAEGWQITADIAGPETLANIAGVIRDPLGTPGFDGQINADADDLSIFADLAGMPLKGALSAAATGQISFDLSTFDLDVAANGAGLGIGNASVDTLLAGDLNAAVVARRSGPQIMIDQLGLSTDLLQVEGAGTMSSEGAMLDIVGELANIAPFVPGFQGAVTVRGGVGQTSDGNFTIDLSARGPGGSTANAAGTLAADASAANIKLDGAAPLAFANRFIEPRTLSGTATFDLALNGPLDVASLSGQVRTADARFFAPTLNVELENLDLTADIGGGRVALDATTNVATGGQIALSGPITLSGNYAADLTVRLIEAGLTDPTLYETTINGALTVQGPLTGGAEIGGALTLGQTNIRIPSSGLGGAGAVPEVVHLNEPPPARATRARAGLLKTEADAAESRPARPFPLAITVTAPNQIFVRGRGLDSEFGGNLSIGGSTANVIPSGAFNLIRGRLDILGQRLDLEEATITMQGSLIPVVRIRASTESDEYVISVLVSGPVTNPDITFQSEPNLPEEEVVARLLFGRGIDQLSPIQAARLALAVRTLAGLGGEGIVSNVRSRTGLADLDVTTDEEGNAAVRAGAYLSENVYTDVTVGSGGTTELNLNLDVSRSLTVTGTVTNEGDTSIGIFFERDY